MLKIISNKADASHLIAFGSCGSLWFGSCASVSRFVREKSVCSSDLFLLFGLWAKFYPVHTFFSSATTKKSAKSIRTLF